MNETMRRIGDRCVKVACAFALCVALLTTGCSSSKVVLGGDPSRDTDILNQQPIGKEVFLPGKLVYLGGIKSINQEERKFCFGFMTKGPARFYISDRLVTNDTLMGEDVYASAYKKEGGLEFSGYLYEYSNGSVGWPIGFGDFVDELPDLEETRMAMAAPAGRR